MRFKSGYIGNVDLLLCLTRRFPGHLCQETEDEVKGNHEGQK